jgi:hypothetical protein
MATVDKEFADNLIKNQGYYNGDSDNELGDNPRCVLITAYNNAFGGRSYGLTFQGDPYRYSASPFVQEPEIIWDWYAEKIMENLKGL